MRTFLALAILIAALAPPAARASDSYHNCVGTITSLPAVISTPGVWCLRTDQTTAMSSGIAVTINGDNITLDCNEHRIDGLAAGAGTLTHGVFAEDRLNVTIRDCNIRGFRHGVLLSGGGGHLVERNRLDGNTRFGIQVSSPASRVRDNFVWDTGAAFASGSAMGIYGLYGVHISNNVIHGVQGSGTNANAYGISVHANGDANVVGNDISGLSPAGNGIVYGIRAFPAGLGIIEGNRLTETPRGGIGISCENGMTTAVRNIVTGFVTGIQYCTVADNVVN